MVVLLTEFPKISSLQLPLFRLFPDTLTENFAALSFLFSIGVQPKRRKTEGRKNQEIKIMCKPISSSSASIYTANTVPTCVNTRRESHVTALAVMDIQVQNSDTSTLWQGDTRAVSTHPKTSMEICLSHVQDQLLDE